jgi:hypothetical protein
MFSKISSENSFTFEYKTSAHLEFVWKKDFAEILKSNHKIFSVIKSSHCASSSSE